MRYVIEELEGIYVKLASTHHSMNVSSDGKRMERRVDICVPRETNNDCSKTEIEIDWKKCLICQRVSGPLQNPRNNPAASDVSVHIQPIGKQYHLTGRY